MYRWLTMMTMVLVLTACEGPMGPEGPQGPQGPQGEQGPAGPEGPGTRLVLTGTLNSSGSGLVHFPPDAGTLSDPPSVTCYIASSAGSDAWLTIATSDLGGSCGISTHGGHLDGVIVASARGWAFRIVVVY